MVGDIFGIPSIKITHLIDPIPLTNMAARNRQFCLFLVGRFLKIFSSETAWQIKRNFTGNIYGRSSIRFHHFILIGQKKQRHMTLGTGTKMWRG
jgi:hypothetical protein